MMFRKVTAILSDNSKAYNVEGVVDGATITIGATSEYHAEILAEALNDSAWMEVQAPGRLYSTVPDEGAEARL